MTIDSVSNQKINTLDLAAINAAGNAGRTKVAVDEVIPPVEQPESDGSSGLPVLTRPTTSVNTATLAGLALPSLGATILALVSDTADESRRATTEARKAQSQAIVQTIQNQAEEMRSQATTKLVFGLVSGSVQLFTGAAGMIGSYCNMNSGLEGDALATRNAFVQSGLQGAGGVKSMIEAGGESMSAGYDVQIKKMDADIEKMRADITQLDSLTDALKQVISKATSVQADIQANVNQTRTKILS